MNAVAQKTRECNEKLESIKACERVCSVRASRERVPGKAMSQRA